MVRIDVQYTGNLHTECLHEPSGTRLETDAPRDIAFPVFKPIIAIYQTSFNTIIFRFNPNLIIILI